MTALRDNLAPLRAELLALAEGTVQALGPDEWTVDPRRIPDWHPCAELVRAEDGARILIQQERLRSGRWNLHGVLPDSTTYYYRHDIETGTSPSPAPRPGPRSPATCSGGCCPSWTRRSRR
ncbi:hypothetical protein [Kitasatospora fiedleri]|uniref:hypothetical protein n=1 Tax=Kitasatospora fiedleri TaxID=2991545 RepID=UPI00249BA536|nr:hypothetical protein [Kitasatospora fiedleri]